MNEYDSKWFYRAEMYAYLLYLLISDGANVLEQFEEAAKRDGFLNEDGFWIEELDQ